MSKRGRGNPLRAFFSPRRGFPGGVPAIDADRSEVTKRHIMALITAPKAKFFLLSLVVMASLIVVQRFYLSRSDTGKPWALMSAWFGLCAWFSRSG